MSDVSAELPQTPSAEPPEDFSAYEAWREAGGGATDEVADEKAPAVGDQPPSEPSDDDDAEAIDAEDDGQTAEESDPEEEEEQETPLRAKPGEPNRRLSKRMRELTGEIKKLKSQLAGRSPSDVDEEAEGEVVSPPESVEEELAAAEPAKLVRPMLKDFEDTDEMSAWDQYEAAMEEYQEARTAKTVAKALQDERQITETKQQQAVAEALWNKAAARFPDYNEVVREEVKISQAMESVMRMDPESGTELAYYLGQHPEESETIAKQTLAASEKHWPGALARAGMLLGEIRAKLSAEKKAPPKPPGAPSTPAPQPLKKVSTASKPPTQIRGTPVPPAFNLNNDDDARNYKKWEQAREAQIAKSGKR